MAAQRSNGVLSISASATQRPVTKPPTKASTPRMKVVIRRLPPSLTLAEFEATMGEDWKVNGEKVDWFNFKPGKLSKEWVIYWKPSRRLY